MSLGRPVSWMVLLANLAGVLAEAAPPAAGATGKIGSDLRRLQTVAEWGPGPAASLADQRGLALDTSSVEPRVYAVIETAALAAIETGALEAAGARVVQTADGSAAAWIPLGRLEAIAALPQVLAIRRPIPPTWEIVGEGLARVGGDRMVASGHRGQGVKIGIIDEFRNYTDKLGSELPPPQRVIFRSFLENGGQGGSSHGVQVAEILNDFAPDATFYLCAIEDDVGYRNAVTYLVSQGVRVINHSGGFGLFGDLSGGGPLHESIARSAAAGILYVGAAGNNADSHWEGVYRDSDGNGWHEFAPGIERLMFDVSDSTALDLRIDLSWNDWLPNPADPRPTSDYDLCLYDAGGRELSCASDPQNGQAGQLPYELVSFKVPAVGAYSLAVRKRSGGDAHLEVSLIPNYSFGALAVPASSLIVPADDREVLAVGAVDLFDGLREYSSHGPTNDGRLKPDLVAPDGVITSLGRFYGTSAATPHVAGSAAQLLSLDPGLTRGALRDRLLGHLVQSPADPTPGPDNLFGNGRLDANFAGAGGPSPTPVPTQPPSGGGGSSGGGGCRVSGEPAGSGELAAVLLVVLLYGAWLARRG